MARFDDRLDDAIDRLMAEKELPEDAELSALLEPMHALVNASVPAPLRRTARMRMNAALEQQRNRSVLLVWPHWLRLGQLASVAVVLLMVIVMTLANFALPGQPLFPLKRGAETAVERLYRSPEARSRYYVRLANRRLMEMERLVAQNRSVPPFVLAQFRHDWEQATSVPGVELLVWRQDAIAQARRLHAIIPDLPDTLQQEAEDVLLMLLKLAGGDRLPPIPSQLSPVATLAPTSIPPFSVVTSTPTPTATCTATETPTQARRILATQTPSPTTPPTLTATPTPTNTPTHEEDHHNTDTPVPTETPTHGGGDGDDQHDDGPAPTHTPEHDDHK